MLGRWRLARFLVLLGLAAVAVAVFIDAPAALDEGETAIQFVGARGQGPRAFWVEIFAGVVIAACGPLLALNLQPAGARRRRAAARKSRGRDQARRERSGARRYRGRLVNEDGSGPRLERLLPVACLVAAGLLFASEFMTAFEFTPPGAEALGDQSSHDRHAWAPAVLAVFATGALVAAVLSGSKPAAFAVAACGVLALLIFLLLDLPDAGNVGTFDDENQTFATAEAVPQPGFWLLGALGLAISGAALATIRSERSLRPGHGARTPPTQGRGTA